MPEVSTDDIALSSTQQRKEEKVRAGRDNEEKLTVDRKSSCCYTLPTTDTSKLIPGKGSNRHLRFSDPQSPL